MAVAVPFGTNSYNLVGAGIGIAIVDGFTAAGAKAFGLQMRPFDCADQLEVVIMQNSERPPTRDVESFVALLRQTAAMVSDQAHSMN